MVDEKSKADEKPNLANLEALSVTLSVALFSRIDYCGDGYRRRLVEKLFALAVAERSPFNVLVGGLVSGDGVRERIAEKIAQNKQKPKNKRLPRDEVVARVIRKIAKELAEQLPAVKLPGTDKIIRLYVMTSPAYDGKYGAQIAEELAMLRSDIRHWAKWNEHLPLEPAPHAKFKEIACLVPKSQTFRSKYDSTAPERVVEDYLNLAKKPYAPIVVVGCYNVAFFKPAGGESPINIISLPGASRTEENRASENQIGLTILRFTKEGDLFVKRHNFNDLVVQERESINISPKYNKKMQRVLETFRHRTWWTIGLLSDELKMPQDEVKSVLDSIVAKPRLNPPLEYDETSQRYYIPRPWIQQNVTYPYAWPEKALIEKRFLSFGCLHALCRHTAHEFMLEDVPNLMLKYDIRHLIGGGDFIEGRSHGLPENGELLFGADYVEQECFAAWLVSEALLRPFKPRLHALLQTADKKLFTDETAVLNFILSTLSDFWYIPGNHDEWTERLAFKALKVFRYELLKLVRQGVTETLRSSGLVVPASLEKFLEEYLVKMQPLDAKMHTSGVTISLNHLHMGRTQTKTIRSQSLLSATDAMVNIHANFHTALAMSRFDPNLGQRVIQQIGTLKIRSGFEDRKGKKVDFGVGFLRIGLESRGERKILRMHEDAFFGDPTKFKSLDNEGFITDFRKKLAERGKK